MAAAPGNPIKDLQEELTCPICLENFKDPVSIECGHSFCRTCISHTWRGIHSHYSCPQCRKVSKWKFLRPNRLVKNMVEISYRLVADKPNEGYKRKCKKHQEPLKLYCQDDGEEICVICRESVDHGNHSVVPLEESTKEFKAEIQDRLQVLRKKSADIVQMKTEVEEKALKLQGDVLQKRKMVASEFEALRQLLADRERDLACRLEKMEKTIIQKRRQNIAKLDEQLSSLQKVIKDLEKNYVPPKFTKNEEFKDSVSSHPPAKRPLSRICIQSSTTSTLDFFRSFTVPVTIDLKTVSPNLLVTNNRKCIRYEEQPLHLIPCVERFDSKPCVLATAGYRSGKRYWEVEVGGGIYWTIGVAKRSVSRKGAFRIEPNGGIWAIGLLGMYTDRYYAFTNPDTLLNPKTRPERIAVYLNCDECYVSFYNAESSEHLHTFNLLTVDMIFPFFCVGALGTELRLD